ncbi:MAG: hypothetical protein LBD16_07320, partial [Oscillospiraceae bacterium]|nr:hypothetical protein [Oscillospiraceae bacterium]
MAKRIDIRTAEELMKIGTDGEYPSDGIYTLKADIKIDAPWTPLPNAAGIEIYGEGCWIGPLDAPLFESITSGVIQHVRVEVSIDGRESGKPVGGIAREGVRMDMDACEVYGSITGVSLVGGFFGSMTDSDVWGLHNYANISATSGIVGGILGLGRGNRFRDCWNHGVISALGINGDTKGFAGGIVGIETPALRSHEAEPREPFIEFCFNRG